ncbi:MAG: hypothetical protein Tsb0034_14070 [Ekhidna sp.]
MRIILFLLITGSVVTSFAQTDEEQIMNQAKQFSAYFMAGEREKMVDMYTSDAKIFPNDRGILEGEELSSYWNPETPSKWKTTYHRITPVEIKVLGNEAYDYGYYEGTSTNGEQTSDWRGKYVIIWRKEDGVWKMYLDIWNRIKN